MVTEAEYVEQQRQLGRRVHEHDGVSWDTTYPFYCRPVYEFRAFRPGAARPRWGRSFLGYSHQVPDRALGNRVLEFMILHNEDLRRFEMQRLDTKKRNQVRKGLKCCQVEPISALADHLEEAREINVSQARRHMAKNWFDKPQRYYSDHADAWQREVLDRFGLNGWMWWGAFVGKRLVAYMITSEVERTLFIRAMKTHTDGFHACATDAIYYTVLTHARTAGTFDIVVNGRPLANGVNRYKEQFLFRRAQIPYYTFPRSLFRLGLGLLRLKEAVRTRAEVARVGAGGRPSESACARQEASDSHGGVSI